MQVARALFASQPNAPVRRRFELAYAHPPVFIVGCPRSGTTLTRLILDAHSELAIPIESHFLLGLRPRAGRRRRPDDALDSMLRHFSVRRWDVDLDAVRTLVRDAAPSDFSGVARALFAAYAALKGKTRWGDKTPGYVSFLPYIASLFPDAKIVHVIRDGREAGRSMAEQPWGPRSAVSGGFWWSTKVARGREFGSGAQETDYAEVRLEALTADPQAVSRTLCTFVGLPFEDSMLRFHENAPSRVPLAGRSMHPHLVRPVTQNLRNWRSGLSEHEQLLVQAACGHLLVDLGYADEELPRPIRRKAGLVGIRDAAIQLPHDLVMRMRPHRRRY